MSVILAKLRRIRQQSEQDPFLGLKLPLILSVFFGLLSSIPVPYWPSLFVASLGAALAGLYSRTLRRAVLSILLLHAVHSFAISLLSGLFVLFLLLSFVPGSLILGALLPVGLLARYSAVREFRGRTAKGAAAACLIVLAVFASIPALPVGSSSIYVYLQVVATQTGTQGLTVLLPAPILGNTTSTVVFSHPNPGGVPTDQWLTDAVALVDSDFGPAVKFDVKSLPYEFGPVYNDPDFPDTALYMGTFSFRMQLTYPSPMQTGWLQLSHKANITQVPYNGPLGSTYGGPLYSFKAPIWITVPAGLGVKISVSTGSFTTKSLDPYSPIIRQDEFGENINIHNPSGTAWIWAEGGGRWRTLYRGPFSD